MNDLLDEYGPLVTTVSAFFAIIVVIAAIWSYKESYFAQEGQEPIDVTTFSVISDIKVDLDVYSIAFTPTSEMTLTFGDTAYDVQSSDPNTASNALDNLKKLVEMRVLENKNNIFVEVAGMENEYKRLKIINIENFDIREKGHVVLEFVYEMNYTGEEGTLYTKKVNFIIN